MQEFLAIFLVLLAVLAGGHLLAPRLRVPAPVLLALLGAAAAFIPGLPLKPLDEHEVLGDVILFVFLPPLLYADAFDTSWTDFRRWLRPILMLAIGLVAFTILAVGVVAHWLMPQVPWAACFILGAIVSPTDTIAVQNVLERLRVPRRITAIIGGESLVNDATGLLGVQIGAALLYSGAFEGKAVALEFAQIAGGGLVIGVVAGILFSLLNRRVRDVHVLFVLSLVAPYATFLGAHELGTSGVLAVVIAGFVVSWRIHDVPAVARVELYSAWSMLQFVLNGLSFAIIGLFMPSLMKDTQLVSGSELFSIGLVVSATVILARIVWVLPMAYIPLFLMPWRRKREGGYPPWRGVVLASWCGLRGAVSLAAALSVASFTGKNEMPGGRALLACTLVVILVTLVVQGVTLAPLVKLLGLPSDEDSAAEVLKAREEVLAAGVRRLDEYCSETSCPVSVHHWREAMADELATLKEEDEEQLREARTRLSVSQEVRREVAQAQAEALLGLRDSGVINDRTYLDIQIGLDREHLDAAPMES